MLKNVEFCVRGTLQLVSRLPPTVFFEIWGRPRFPIPCPKNYEKNTGGAHRSCALAYQVPLSYLQPIPRYLMGNFLGIPHLKKIPYEEFFLKFDRI